MNNPKAGKFSETSAVDRFQYFVKTVAKLEIVWGLQADDWASTEAVDGGMILPFWAEEKSAEFCASGLFEGYTATKIKLSDFMGLWLPGMLEDGVKVGLFMTPCDQAIAHDSAKLMTSIEEELRSLNS